MYTAMLYLRDLRERQKLSRSVLGRAIGAESKQIYRWEKGENTPPFPALLLFAQRVQASVDHLVSLLQLDDDDIVSQRVAQELALDRWEELQAQMRLSAQDEQTERLYRAIDQLRADPARLACLAGYADRLLDEMNDTV